MEIQESSIQQRFRVISSTFLVLVLGCTTTQLEPPTELPPDPPPYVQVPHPSGLDSGDLKAIFQQKDSPKPDVTRNCEADFFTLRERTQSKEEFAEGVKQLVRLDPVKYHWCFYSKIMELDAALKKDIYVDERQKSVIHAYLFIAPVARVFFSEFNDSRYLRWAISRYKTLSEYVFYRKVEPSPHLTSELVGSSNPYGFVKPSEEHDVGILEKYGLAIAVDPVPAVSPEAASSESTTNREIAGEATDLPDPSPKPEATPSLE